MTVKLTTGKPYPLGATWDGQGTNFALYSENATGVKLCLFDNKDHETRFSLVEQENHVWYGYIKGIKPGQKYGFRVEGAYQPEQGHRFNPCKLLIDPYAKAIAGNVSYGQELFDYSLADNNQSAPSISYLALDNAHLIPKSIVVDDHFDWEGDQPLQLNWQQTIIYETHVKSFTYLHPEIPEHLRGTYKALEHPITIKHLKSLGITAIELLPVHHIFSCPQFLHEKGLKDYWGYRTLGYFAPYSGYSSSGILGEQVTEFKQMVKTLHREGIEVILDVVYNHSAEGKPTDQTLFLRGIDNAVYYVLNEDNKSEYLDFTACGNSLNIRHPQVLKLIIDSLRYWVEEMHVDGFRFDEAPTLARECLTSEYQIELHLNQEKSQSFSEKITKLEYDRGAAFFDIIHQDPVLSKVKLIAEAWDAGNNGDQVGKFPLLWSEWNGIYRDTIRDFWRGELSKKQQFIDCFQGSPNLYQSQGKAPYSSINLITCHDGFTLEDLVTYNEKHNEINGENSKDGTNHNQSWNCGVEGETDNPEILALRAKQKRNLLTTLILSQGVPMILGGDEIGRTQQGNNNAYNQDNEISWYNWHLTETEEEWLNFVRQLIAFRQQHPIFSQRHWLQSRDFDWFIPNRDQENESDDNCNVIAIFLNGERSNDDSFLMFFNGEAKPMTFTIANYLQEQTWKLVIDTNESQIKNQSYSLNQSLEITPYSLLILLYT